MLFKRRYLLFNKKQVIKDHSEYLEEVDVRYLEPTGVYVVNTSDYDGIPVLIADSIIEIPDNGKVEIDLTTTGYPWTYVEREAMESLAHQYILPGDRFFDSATPYCKELMDFKNRQIKLCIAAATIETLVLTIVLVVASIVAAGKKKGEET